MHRCSQLANKTDCTSAESRGTKKIAADVVRSSFYLHSKMLQKQIRPGVHDSLNGGAVRRTRQPSNYFERRTRADSTADFQ